MGFRVGQKVRIVANHATADGDLGNIPIGHEGIIVRAHEVAGAWIVRTPTCVYPSPSNCGCADDEWGCYESELQPLTDPGCESFLQAMHDYANKQRTPVDVLRELHGEYL
jgi:hypothetical protein